VSGVANHDSIAPMAPILWFFFAIALFFAFFRLFFMLITAYIQVLISVVMGPLQILLDVFPGTNGFLSWITGMTANLLTFFLVSVFLLIDAVILQNLQTVNLWSPPFIGFVNAGLLQAIIGIGFLLTIPTLINSVKQAMKAQSPINVGLGTVLGPVGTVASSGLQLSQQFFYLQHSPLARFIPGNKPTHT